MKISMSWKCRRRRGHVADLILYHEVFVETVLGHLDKVSMFVKTGLGCVGDTSPTVLGHSGRVADLNINVNFVSRRLARTS